MRKKPLTKRWGVRLLPFLLFSLFVVPAHASVEPERFETTLRAGEFATDPIQVFLPGRIPKADILFSLDLTGSMSMEISLVKKEILNIMSALDAVIEDARYGVISYMDYPGYYCSYGYCNLYGHAYYGDYAYHLDVPLTDNRELVQSKVSELRLGWGADWPEDYARIFYEAYTDPLIGYREDAKKILINFGDATPHDNNILETIYPYGSSSTGGDPGRDAIMFTHDDLDFQRVLQEMATHQVILFHINSGGRQDLWQYWARMTGGDSILLSDATEIPKVVLGLIESQAEKINSIEGLTLQAPTEFQGFVESITPSFYANLVAPASLGFEILLGVPPGTAPGEYEFVVKAMGDGLSFGEHHIIITVPEEEGGEGGSSKNPLGKVTGGGFILDSTETFKKNFGFNIRYYEDGRSEVKGELQFVDRELNLAFHGDEAVSLEVDGNRARFTGSGRLNGEEGYTYKVEVVDNGNPGKGNDTFSIMIEGATTYSASGTLAGGNIQVHQLKKKGKKTPDLIITALSTPTTILVPGGGFVLSNTAKNEGRSSAGSFDIAFRLSSDSVYGGTDDISFTTIRSVASLGAGENSTASSTLTVPSTTPLGSYRICALADSGNTVLEGDETNNSLCTTSTIQVTRPDLLMTQVIPNASSVATGGPLLVTNTVQNQGAVPSGGFLIAYRLSVNTVYGDSDDVMITTTRSIASLAVGASDTATTSLFIPATTGAGHYYVCARADAGNVVLETDETNNALCSSSTITLGPDLVMSAVSGPSSAGAGSTITLSNTVKNQGTRSTISGFYIGLYLSTDATITPSDRFLGRRWVGGLSAGASSSGSTTVVIPTTVAAGTYYLGAIADYTGLISESNEANNAKAGNTIATTLMGPDLVMSAVSGPSSAGAGSTITLSNTVKNQGTRSTISGFYIGLYLSTDATITPSDRFLGRRWVGGLSAGASSSGSTTVVIPTTVAAGTYYLGAIADYTGLISESNEANNARTGNTIQVTVKDTTPPVIVPTITPAPNAAGWNNTDVTVRWSVTDPESAILSSSGCGSITLTAETAGTTLICTATSGGGTSSKSVTVKIDKTPPVISGLPAPGCTLWPPNHKLVQVATVTASDGLSGLGGSLTLTGTSNEPEDGLGGGDTAPDIVITDGTVQLRAERSGTGTGRIYTLTATVQDQAGNRATATATCTVPLKP